MFVCLYNRRSLITRQNSIHLGGTTLYWCNFYTIHAIFKYAYIKFGDILSKVIASTQIIRASDYSGDLTFQFERYAPCPNVSSPSGSGCRRSGTNNNLKNRRCNLERSSKSVCRATIFIMQVLPNKTLYIIFFVC